VVRPVKMILLEQEVCTITQGQSVYPDIALYVSISASQSLSRNGDGHVKSVQPIKCMLFILICNIIQLMTFHEVNTRIDQPMKHDIHRGCLGRVEYHVPWVDQSLYSPKLKVINCFII
jgi:hypothetical protein